MTEQASTHPFRNHPHAHGTGSRGFAQYSPCSPAPRGQRHPAVLQNGPCPVKLPWEREMTKHSGPFIQDSTGMGSYVPPAGSLQHADLGARVQEHARHTPAIRCTQTLWRKETGEVAVGSEIRFLELFQASQTLQTLGERCQLLFWAQAAPCSHALALHFILGV